MLITYNQDSILFLNVISEIWLQIAKAAAKPEVTSNAKGTVQNTKTADKPDAEKNAKKSDSAVPFLPLFFIRVYILVKNFLVFFTWKLLQCSLFERTYSSSFLLKLTLITTGGYPYSNYQC